MQIKDNIMSNKPLTWCVDWQNLTAKEKFLMGMPFIGTDVKAYKDINTQLKTRSEADLQEWDSYPKEISELAKQIIELYKKKKLWPNPIFLPQDPADIAFCLRFDLTDKYDLLPDSIWVVEQDIGIKMDEEFWHNLHHYKFYQSIEIILKNK
ncbi:MAG: hypothetical protein CR975_05740 [Gammaproteobacteria bacterium]|nr:MAG: hypothetical protein CR975_05740 [Gammaproteobacteria bacterium]